MATPEDWAAMEPYQEAITARTREYHALASAARHVDSAVKALADAGDGATPLLVQLRRELDAITGRMVYADAAMQAAGLAASAEWEHRTG